MAEAQGNKAIRLCGSIEMEISTMDTEDRQLFLEEYTLSEPGLHKLIRSAYELLGLETFLLQVKKKSVHGQLKKDILHLKLQELFILIFNEGL